MSVAVRYFLRGLRRGAVVSGTVESVHNFGVFLCLDGEPDPGGPTGFVRIPDIKWRDSDENVVVGDRVRGEVIDIDLERMQARVSLKALKPDPLTALVGRVGEVMRGPITMIVEDRAVFVRIIDGVEAPVPRTEVLGEVRVGDEMAVEIVEVSLKPRRFRVRPWRAPKVSG